MEELVAILTTAPQDALEGDQLVATTRVVQQALRDLDQVLSETWQAYSDQLEWIPANLWAAFQDNAEVGPLVRKAMRQDEEWDSIRRQQRLDSLAQEKFTQLRNNRQLLLSELPDVSDEEVRAFVVSAGSSGAALSALSVGVRAWLVQNDLMDAYRVVQNSK